MFNKKSEKKEPKSKDVGKSTDFYDNMIDEIFAGITPDENGSDQKNGSDDYSKLFSDSRDSSEKPAEDNEDYFFTDTQDFIKETKEEVPEKHEEAEEPAESEPKDHHGVDIHKWKSETITSISEEYSEDRINSNEVDDELLIALGYVNSNQKNEAIAENLLPEKLFALEKEFSDIREADGVYDKFVGAKKRIEIRICATLLSTLILCLYPYIAALLKNSIAFFDCERFFVPNMLVCLQLLLIAAAFSASDLFFGFLKIFTGKPTVYSPSGLLTVLTTAVAIVYAFTASPSGDFSCSLFMTVTATSLLVPLFADLCRVKQQMDSFELSTAKEDPHSSRLDLSDGEYILAHKGIPKDFSERTRAPYESAKVLNFLLLPSLLLTAMIGTVIYLTTKNAEAALITASTASCVLFPTAQLLTSVPFHLNAHSILNAENAAIIGRTSVDELETITEISINENEIFDRNATNPINMQIFSETLYTTIYCTSSLTRTRRSPISSLFAENIEDGDLSSDVQTVEETQNGIAAIIDNKYAVLCGNEKFMREHDFDIPEPSPEDLTTGTTLIYTAINGKIAASICVDYSVRKDFADILHAATENEVKLKIYSYDFGVTRSVISAKLGIYDNAFDLIKEKMPLPSGLSPAVTSDNPAALFEAPAIARTLKKAEKVLGIYAGIVSAISVIPAIAVAALGLQISPYIILLYQAVIALPTFIISKIYFQGKNN